MVCPSAPFCVEGQTVFENKRDSELNPGELRSLSGQLIFFLFPFLLSQYITQRIKQKHVKPY